VRFFVVQTWKFFTLGQFGLPVRLFGHMHVHTALAATVSMHLQSTSVNQSRSTHVFQMHVCQ